MGHGKISSCAELNILHENSLFINLFSLPTHLSSQLQMPFDNKAFIMKGVRNVLGTEGLEFCSTVNNLWVVSVMHQSELVLSWRSTTGVLPLQPYPLGLPFHWGLSGGTASHQGEAACEIGSWEKSCAWCYLRKEISFVFFFFLGHSRYICQPNVVPIWQSKWSGCEENKWKLCNCQWIEYTQYW